VLIHQDKVLIFPLKLPFRRMWEIEDSAKANLNTEFLYFCKV